MTVVSSNEFIRNQDKYFDLAIDENIIIERGGNIFHLTCSQMEISPIGNYSAENLKSAVLLSREDICNGRIVTIEEMKAKHPRL